MALFTIQLHHLHFFAEHGMYDEERSVGNEFEVNISIDIKAPKEKLTSIADTVNYAEVYRITKEIFSVRKPLLETLAMELAGAVKKQFPAIRNLQIQIIKLHPPISGFAGSVSVTYNKAFK